MLTLSKLDRWLTGASENEHMEFKEAKQQYEAYLYALRAQPAFLGLASA